MLRSLLISPWKIAAEKLQKIGLWHTNSKFITSYKELAVLVITDIIKHKKIKTYIAAMLNAKITPELLIKYSTLIHTYLQQQNDTQNDQNVIDFLSRFFQISAQKIQQYAKIDQEQGSFSSNNKSTCNRSASTCSEEIIICKEIFLISTIVRPYLAFLLKYSYSISYIKLLKHKSVIQTHQAWTVINLLKMIILVTTNFTMIGRYYIRSYGFLVILLTKTFSKCIHQFMEILNKNVNSQRVKYTLKVDTQGYQFGEFMKMLQQISKINDKLLPLYLSKYFFDKVQDIPEPKWINTSSSDFDKIFQLKKSIEIEQDILLQRNKSNSSKNKNIIEFTQKV